MVSFHRRVQKHCFLPAQRCHSAVQRQQQLLHVHACMHCDEVQQEYSETGASEGKESSARVGCKLPKLS
jgi:hypothetical protein